jgi:hypothetical protein
MDTNKLFKAIQIIVQEEVKKEVAKREKAIRESILKEIKSNPIQKQTPKVEADPLEVGHIFESQTPKKKGGPKFEGKFASLLNETADSGEWRSINSTGGAFHSNQAMAWGAMNQTPDILQTAEGRAVPVEQLQQTEAGKAVVDALTRDYSGLMKAINAKKGR